MGRVFANTPEVQPGLLAPKRLIDCHPSWLGTDSLTTSGKIRRIAAIRLHLLSSSGAVIAFPLGGLSRPAATGNCRSGEQLLSDL